jgi:alpha-beta hydrolase superfamily lysophospholipase
MTEVTWVGRPESARLVDADGVGIYVDRWLPPGHPKAAVHVAHGMGEHARRYGRLASALGAAGYAVYADDHRGSGRTGLDGGGLGDLGPHGMQGALDALHVVTAQVRAEHPDLAVHLVGHSWGSFLAQRAVERWGDELRGVVLSGSTLLVEQFRPSGDLNAPFHPAATPYDWLTRDAREVALYIEDPWCGFEVAFPVEELRDLDGPPAAGVPAGLAVLVLNGSQDAVGGVNGGGAALAEAYRSLGLADVTYRAYPGGRHELFNETNRDEVTADLIAWLDDRV